MEAFTGKVWVLGDDIDTDIIIPTEYLALKTIDDMKQYGFSPLRPELAGQIQKGDIIVAGKNFGCGSSREQAPEIIKALGVQCVIAKSFARIFFRNSINNGLLLIEQPDLPDRFPERIPDDLQIPQRSFLLPALHPVWKHPLPIWKSSVPAYCDLPSMYRQITLPLQEPLRQCRSQV